MPEFDRRRARDLYRRGCTPDTLDPSGCYLAAEPERIARLEGEPRWVGAFEERPDLRFLYLDRGCELVDKWACVAIRSDFRDRPGEAAAQLFAYYDLRWSRTMFRSPREIREQRLERIASGWPGALERGQQDEVTTRKRSHHAALERRVVRERLPIGLLRWPGQRRFQSFEGLRGSVEVSREGGVCLSRCPAPTESPDPAAAQACFCGCLLETQATSIPEAILARCRDGKPPLQTEGY